MTISSGGTHATAPSRHTAIGLLARLWRRSASRTDCPIAARMEGRSSTRSAAERGSAWLLFIVVSPGDSPMPRYRELQRLLQRGERRSAAAQTEPSYRAF